MILYEGTGIPVDYEVIKSREDLKKQAIQCKTVILDQFERACSLIEEMFENFMKILEMGIYQSKKWKIFF